MAETVHHVHAPSPGWRAPQVACSSAPRTPPQPVSAASMTLSQVQQWATSHGMVAVGATDYGALVARAQASLDDDSSWVR